MLATFQIDPYGQFDSHGKVKFKLVMGIGTCEKSRRLLVKLVMFSVNCGTDHSVNF